ncbi:Trimeric intracellular cation channel type 1B.2 [Fragariocoptes setiger]|uniref:Trimeric intracellular cation channel type 1B.2 n=1 Tax=Fragariocoptes setiger TaxID=1670756 RepID=A0ABQ7S6K7_9ACAR|nr:Trimeric intracellular cation channel type 1B.2 [Fragariocoptes setiger]
MDDSNNNLVQWAGFITRAPIYPYLELVHIVSRFMQVRAHLGPSLVVSRRQPFACWLVCMASIFGAPMLALTLINEPPVGALQASQHVMLASISWYLIFYTPLDLFHRCVAWAPCRLALALANELHRCKRIHESIVHTSKIYPTSYFVIVLVAYVRANTWPSLSPLLAKTLGLPVPTALSMSIHEPEALVAPKISLLAALVFLIERRTTWLSPAPHSLVFTCTALVMIYVRLTLALGVTGSPLASLEQMLRSLVFGGFVDALANTIWYTQSNNNHANARYMSRSSNVSFVSSSNVKMCAGFVAPLTARRLSPSSNMQASSCDLVATTSIQSSAQSHTLRSQIASEFSKKFY